MLCAALVCTTSVAAGQTPPPVGAQVTFPGLTVTALSTPAIPTGFATWNCSGSTSTTYNYSVAAVDFAGGSTALATGAPYPTMCPVSTLSRSIYNYFTTPPVPGSAACNVYRNITGSSNTYFIGNVPCGSVFYDFNLSATLVTSVPTGNTSGGISVAGVVNAQAINAGGTGAGTEILMTGVALTPFCANPSPPFSPCIPSMNAFFQQAPSSSTYNSWGITWPSTSPPNVAGPFIFGAVAGATNASPVTVGTLTNSSSSNLVTGASNFVVGAAGNVVTIDSSGNAQSSGTLLTALAVLNSPIFTGTPTVPGYVPTSTTVNGHALSSNVTVSASDVGLGSVTNNIQTQAAIMPNTMPTAGQVPVGNGTAYVPQSLSGDCTLASSGAMTCTKTNGTPFAASATTDTTNASNISSGTLPHSQLPTLLSGDIPNNAANTSGTAANLSGTPALPTGTTVTTSPGTSDNSMKIATTAYVQNQNYLEGIVQKQVVSSYTNNTTTLSPFQSTLYAAGQNISFDCRLMWQQSSTSSGMAIGVVASTTPVNVSALVQIYTSNTATAPSTPLNSLGVITATGSAGKFSGANAAATGTTYRATVYGTVETNATTGGTLSIEAASTAATTLTIVRGSYCEFF